MNSFAQFLKLKRELLLYAFFSIGLELLVAYLSELAFRPLFYAAFLQGFMLLILLVIEFFKFRKRKKALLEFEDALFDSEATLPAPRDALEEMYQALLQSAREQYALKRREEQKLRNENLNYYTLWVHQIKTPIAAMRLLSTQKEPENALFSQELFKVERYADLALQYARMHELATDLCVERCELNGLVRSCAKKYALLFVYNKLTLKIDPFEQEVLSDAKWLQFAVEQIISNCVKYTKKGGVTIRFSQGVLSFTDTGIGIRKEDVQRVFEKGYTGYNGRVDTRASGIGLYLTRRVLKALRIEIAIESQLHTGTTVKLSFPRDLMVTKL